jgi:hypothetical protein
MGAKASVWAALVACIALACTPKDGGDASKAGTSPGASGQPGAAAPTAGSKPADAQGAKPAAPPAEPNPHAEVLEKLDAERQKLAETVWADERLAQEHDLTFIDLWDQLRGSDDPLTTLRNFEFDRIILGAPAEPRTIEHDISVVQFAPGGPTLSAAQWRGLVDEWRAGGLRLVQTEWHHRAFYKAKDGKPARSVMNMVLHITDAKRGARIEIVGNLDIEWAKEKGKNDRWRPAVIDASKVTARMRIGPPGFADVMKLGFENKEPGKVPAFPVQKSIQPVLVHDLDRDGFPDIILPSLNSIHRFDGKSRYERSEIFPGVRTGNVAAAAILDLTGDGIVDLVLGGNDDWPKVYRGLPRDASKGAAAPYFESEGSKLTGLPEPPARPMRFAAGDIDADGDLDLWLAQYKPPYDGGSMPTPFYDSNDGHPGYLLVNKGDGTFEDGTEAAGLAGKRFRRTFSTSFVDLDGDRDLDLITVNDFAGFDLWANDGKGRFTEVTKDWVEDNAGFGMSHAFGDFDLDGKLDAYVTGMTSTTVRRLNRLNAARKDRPEFVEMRTRMTFGNRMLINRSDKPGVGRFREPEYRSNVSHSGWTYGAVTFDVDNDRDVDLYVSNGFVSGTTAKDYCTHYWSHDIYTGDSEEDPVMLEHFSAKWDKEVANGARGSWNGFEHNHLFLNLGGGRDFVNAGWLFDVAFEADGRALVADDLDRDGRVDFIVVTKHFKPNGKEALDELLVYQNLIPSQGDWIGVTVPPVKGRSPLGATVRVETDKGTQIDVITLGESYKAQRSNTRHFGLGRGTRLKSISVEWPDGHRRELKEPAPNRYHVLAPEAG